MFGIDDAIIIPALIAAASYGGSAYLNSEAADKVSKEQTRVRQLEIARQDEMRKQAEDTFAKLLKSQASDTQAQDIANEVAKLAERYQGGVDTNKFTDLLPGQGDSSATVKMDIVNSGNRGITKAKKSGAARAALDAYGVMGVNNNAKFQGANSDLNSISSASAASNNILPLELQASQNKGNNLRMWGNLLSAAGSIAGSMAAGSAFSSLLAPETAAGATITKDASTFGNTFMNAAKNARMSNFLYPA